MEKEIKEALNFAIGAAKSLREQADSILLKVEKEFKELASKGAQDQSEVAKNLRKYIEDALHSVEGVAGQVNSKVEEVKSKVNQGVSSTKIPLNGSKGKAETAGKHWLFSFLCFYIQEGFYISLHKFQNHI